MRAPWICFAAGVVAACFSMDRSVDLGDSPAIMVMKALVWAFIASASLEVIVRQLGRGRRR